MFFVINKTKIYTYVVTVCMVIMLFALSFAILTNGNAVVTSTNVEQTNEFFNKQK